MSILVGITDDHLLVLEGLATLIQNQPGMEVAFTATTAEATKKRLAERQPDVLLLDIQLPDGDGIELCKVFTKAYPAMKMIAVTGFDKSAFVTRMMQAGASGYLLKNVPGAVLLDAIRRVAQGETVIQQEVQDAVLRHSLGMANEQAGFIPVLTRREREILNLMAEELTSQEMADKLSVTVSTVETHRMNLIQKFGVKNMAGLIREAIRKGLLNP